MEADVKEFAEKLIKYYDALKGKTFGSLVSYTIEQKLKEYLEKHIDK